MRLIIVGNGVAGITVAEQVRRLDGKAKIEIYTDENYGYYSRVWLPELISGGKTVEKIIMHDAKWYESKKIGYHQGTKVAAINPKEKTITVDKSKTEKYDKLCICTGATCNVPPFKNTIVEGVFTLRTIDDALAIKAYIKDKKRAVCIGGGLLGLEAARNIKKTGLETTVVEVFPRLLPKQLCNTSAGILKDKITHLGIDTVLGATVEEIIGTDHVTGVKLAGGRVLDADFVLISAGIKPRLELMQAAGLKVNKGLIVNDYMQTSDENIFAAGDIIEFNNRGWGIIPAALDQAAVTAKKIAGIQGEPYAPTTPSNKLKIMDFDVMSVGTMILDDADQNCKVFISKDEMKGIYKKFVLREGKLIGSILLESKPDEQFVSQNINKPVSDDEVQSHLKIVKKES
nr:FAD-dependent oxidoreductase [Candidatus Sigynarchaeota archaeon]